jgi:hypothetical protein
MNIERPPQKIYLACAWAGALACLALAVWLPSPLRGSFISMSQHLESMFVAIVLCLLAVLAQHIWPERVRQSLCILLGFLSTTLTISLVS